jgi:predicted kinase
VAGLPGTGKSLVSEHAARLTQAALVSKDVVEAALWRSGIGPEARSGWIAYELLTALADAQLASGGSVVLDCVAASAHLRDTWRQLSSQWHAAFIAVECICSDLDVHRSRIEKRKRTITGWPELAWRDVEEVLSRYEPWNEDRLVLDAIHPVEDNMTALHSYLADGRRSLGGHGNLLDRDP